MTGVVGAGLQLNRVAEIIRSGESNPNITNRRLWLASEGILHTVAVVVPPDVVTDAGRDHGCLALYRTNRELQTLHSGEGDVVVDVTRGVAGGNSRDIELENLTNLVRCLADSAQTGHLGGRCRAAAGAVNHVAASRGVTPGGAAVLLVRGIAWVQHNVLGGGVEQLHGAEAARGRLSALEGELTGEVGIVQAVLRQHINHVRVAYGRAASSRERVGETHAPTNVLGVLGVRRQHLANRGCQHLLKLHTGGVRDLHLRDVAALCNG